MPEGWMVDDPTSFRFLADHTPPRPFAVAYALWMDARDRLALAFWIVGIGCIAAGASLKQWLVIIPLVPWLLIALGIVVLSAWLWAFQFAARSFRSDSLSTGIIGRVDPHPFARDWLAADVKQPGGHTIRVALPAKSALELIERQGLAEVIFLGGCHLAFGVRAVPGVSNDRPG